MIRVKRPVRARRIIATHVLAAHGPSAAVSRPRSTPTPIPVSPASTPLHYVFRLGLSDRSNEITGETTITVKFLRDGVADLNLDLTSLSVGKRHDRAVGAARRPDRHAGSGVGQPRRSATPTTGCTWCCRRNQRPDRNSRSRSAIAARPPRACASATNMHGERTFFGENWPNLVRNWLPMIDHPYDKATGEFIVTAPNQYQVVANGVLIEELDLPDNMRRTHWKQSVPIASWLYTIAVARFSSHHAGVVDGVPVQTWVFPQDRDAGQRLFEDLSRRALQFFIANIGPYLVRKARQRAGHRLHRRHGVRERDLLRRKRRQLGPRPGRPRDRAPVVRRFGDRARLGRCVAERGICDLLRAALHGARRGPRCVRRRPEAQPRAGAAARTEAAGRAGHPPQSRRHGARC